MSTQNEVVKSDNASVENTLAARVAELENSLAAATASPQGYPIVHYNVYVNGMPVASPNSLQDALSHAALVRLQSFQAGNGFPEVIITKRTVRHPLRNDMVTEEEMSV